MFRSNTSCCAARLREFNGGGADADSSRARLRSKRASLVAEPVLKEWSPQVPREPKLELQVEILCCVHTRQLRSFLVVGFTVYYTSISSRCIIPVGLRSVLVALWDYWWDPLLCSHTPTSISSRRQLHRVLYFDQFSLYYTGRTSICSRRPLGLLV